MRPNERFEEADVVAHYKYRPPYPKAIFDKLLEIVPAKRSALDLGCGPGKVTFEIAPAFERVTAVDPSAEMLKVAKEATPPEGNNITWINAPAEEAEMVGAPYDLVVAGTAIHWIDHDTIFPKLLEAVSDEYLFAVIEGDGVYNPPWQAEWHEFLTYWVPELTGNPYSTDPKTSAFIQRMTGYRNYIDVVGEVEVLSEPFEQSIDHFIACQYSRATFARSNLGDRIARFNADVREMLTPYAVDNMVTYQVRTTLVYGMIKG